MAEEKEIIEEHVEAVPAAVFNEQEDMDAAKKAHEAWLTGYEKRAKLEAELATKSKTK